MSKTSIEWSQFVWNPVRGCSRVSPGCDNCYAMRQAHRTHGAGGAYEGLTTIRKGKVDWTGFARFVPEQLEVPLRRKKPTTYFVNSMSDLFHHSLSNEHIAAVFGVMAACPQHTFQVLTKRAKRMHEWFKWAESGPHTLAMLEHWAEHWIGPASGIRSEWGPWPLANVWLGVSAENQEQYLKRSDYLARCPAALRWFSLEPLLGPINLGLLGTTPKDWGFGYRACADVFDWFVVGGESGHGARECKVEWIESVVRECQENDVAVFVKQLGAQVYVTGTVRDSDWDGDQETRFAHKADGSTRILLTHSKGGDASAWPEHLRVRQFPEVPT